MSTTDDVLVIGAGIVGVTAALVLLRRGRKVTLVDRLEPARGCSFGNAGVITPSAFPPAASFPPRAIPGLLAGRDSPLTLDWSSAPALLPWAIAFWRSSAAASIRRHAADLHALASNALPAYESLFDGALPYVDRNGYLALHFSDAELAAAQRANAQRAQFGVAARLLSSDALAGLEPAFAGSAQGATFVETACNVTNPAGFVLKLFERFIQSGGVYRCEEVRRITTTSDQRVTVESGERTASFEAVVVATGVRANALLVPLGYCIPLVSERGYHVDLDVPPRFLRRPVALPALGAIVTPTEHGARFAGLAHFGKPGHQMRPGLLSDALARSKTRLAWLREREGATVWSGERPTTPDGLPVVDRLPERSPIYVCAGHGHTGLTLGAVTAEIIADRVCGVESAWQVALSATRFGGHRSGSR